MNLDTKSGNILLIEDSEEDVFFFERALAKCQPVNLTVVYDGKAAIELLSDPDKRRELDVIFLDLKLPFIHGFEVLKWFRAQEMEHPIPVYILSGSSQVQDKTLASHLGATGYLVKPISSAVLQSYLPCLVDRP